MLTVAAAAVDEAVHPLDPHGASGGGLDGHGGRVGELRRRGVSAAHRPVAPHGRPGHRFRQHLLAELRQGDLVVVDLGALPGDRLGGHRHGWRYEQGSDVLADGFGVEDAHRARGLDGVAQATGLGHEEQAETAGRGA